MEKKIPTTFVGEITEGLTQVTPEISKTRLRIFYKGLNRNQGYITDEFAEKLLSSLPYTPVVGIFNDLVRDFGGHNQDRNVARMYGVVPAEPHLAWEDHLDPDGIMRTYACTDVYLYTGRYDAAKLIPGKQQSMELNVDTIRGDWQVINDYGQEGFVYTDARFIGLSVLGNDKTPCFEGSAFYELVGQFNDFMAAKISNGGNDMALDITKPVGGAAESTDPVETELDEAASTTPAEPSETPDGDQNADTPSGDTEESAEDPTDGDSTTDEPKEEDKPADATTEEDKKDEEPADAACDDKKADAEQKEEGKPADSVKDDEADEEPTDDNPDDKKDEQPADHSIAESDFEKISDENKILSDKILDLTSKLATYEAEANKFKDLYTALKADYDVLVAEKNKELAAQKDAKLQEYTNYFSDAVKQDFESRLDSYSTVDDLEKDLLFAAKPSLFAKHDDFAPTSTYEVEEDEIAALIKKSMKH